MWKYMWQFSLDLLLLIFCAVFSITNCLPATVGIGFLYDSEVNGTHAIAFGEAIKEVNRNNSILPNSIFLPIIRHIRQHNSFEASQKANENKRLCSFSQWLSFSMALHLCEMVEQNGVVAIFGPESPDSSAHVQSLCDYMNIPHVSTHWEFNIPKKGNSINLYPHLPTISLAYGAIVSYWKWKKYAIVYESGEGLIRLSGLLKNEIKSSKYDVIARQLPSEGLYHDFLHELKDMDFTRIIVDCSTQNVFKFLKQAQQIGMMTAHHSYLLTTLDLGSVDVEDFQYVGADIVAFQLYHPSSPEVKNMTSRWSNEAHRTVPFTTDAALISDAVTIIANALHELDTTHSIDISKRLSCQLPNKLRHGPTLMNYIEMTRMKDTSPCIISDTRLRATFELDVVQATPNGLIKIGNWTKDCKLKMFPISKTVREIPTDESTIKQKHVNVTVILTPPYTMLKNSSRPLQGNDRFEGFCIDLLNEIAKDLKFNYTIHVVNDSSYGVKISDNPVKWSGLIGEIMDGKADMAIGDVTINSDRESVVDFTMPFMNLGISILYKKPKPQPPNLLSFLSPFSLSVWLCMAGAYIAVCVVLFVLARLSPTEWDNPYPCVQEPENLHNSFGILNSMWFTIGSLMQQGSDIAPKAASTRMVAGIWWFFTLIMISSYTANLAAFLAFEKIETPFNNVEELAKQEKIKYGCVATGSTRAFFSNSNVQIYKDMYKKMMSDEFRGVIVRNNEEGVNRVKEREDYAFLLEKTTIDYYTERNCDVVEVGDLIDNKGYGIALKQGAKYRTELSTSIIKLHETEVIENLKKKWWQRMGGGLCRAQDDPPRNALNLQHVGGIFVVLVAGMLLACIVAVIEFIWKLRSISRQERGSLGHEIFKELVFTLQCKNTKSVRKKRRSEPENGVATPLSNYGYTEREMFT